MRSYIKIIGELIEAADFACVIDRQYKVGTNDVYQVFNVVKRRRIDSNQGELAHVTYMAHPFQKSNGLKLIDDLYMDKVLSLQSLASDIEDAIKPTKQNAVNRPKIKLEEFDEGYEDLSL